MIGVSIAYKGPASTETLLARPMARFLTEAMTLAHGHLSTPGIVPIDTGRLRSSLQPGSGVTGIDPSPLPLWAKVGTNVEYAAPLDAGARDAHYRGGPSAGNPIKGWLSDSPAHLQPQIQSLLPTLATDIQASWNSGA